MKRLARWWREVQDPFDIDDRMPDGPDTTWFWYRFWSTLNTPKRKWFELK